MDKDEFQRTRMVKIDRNNYEPSVYKEIWTGTIDTTFLFSTHTSYKYEDTDKSSQECCLEWDTPNPCLYLLILRLILDDEVSFLVTLNT